MALESTGKDVKIRFASIPKSGHPRILSNLFAVRLKGKEELVKVELRRPKTKRKSQSAFRSPERKQKKQKKKRKHSRSGVQSYQTSWHIWVKFSHFWCKNAPINETLSHISGSSRRGKLIIHKIKAASPINLTEEINPIQPISFPILLYSATLHLLNPVSECENLAFKKTREYKAANRWETWTQYERTWSASLPPLARIRSLSRSETFIRKSGSRCLSSKPSDGA